MNPGPADAAGPAEAPSCSSPDGSGNDPGRLSASPGDYVGDPACSLQELHTDLARFVFLLGGR
jgi:hypothetical protein